MGNSPGANREMFSHVMHTNQLQRGSVVDMNEMFIGPVWLTTADCGVNPALHKNDAAVVQF